MHIIVALTNQNQPNEWNVLKLYPQVNEFKCNPEKPNHIACDQQFGSFQGVFGTGY